MYVFRCSGVVRGYFIPRNVIAPRIYLCTPDLPLHPGFTSGFSYQMNLRTSEGAIDVILIRPTDSIAYVSLAFVFCVFIPMFNIVSAQLCTYLYMHICHTYTYIYIYLYMHV